MKDIVNLRIVWVIGLRTFRAFVESPIAYVVGIFFFGFVGSLFSVNFFDFNQGTIDAIGVLAPWALWFVVPALTMGLISDEIKSGTFENLATLPVRDWEIVLGKFAGFALLALILIGALVFYPILVAFVTDHPNGVDWGENLGILAGLFFMCLLYGAIGIFSSSLARNQVVALILGMIFCTLFFLVGQFYSAFPAPLDQVADFLGVLSHMATLGNGVWDLRDLFYFFSFTAFFLYLAVLRLTTRRF